MSRFFVSLWSCGRPLQARAVAVHKREGLADVGQAWDLGSRPAPTIRSDNGLVFTARRFRAACRDYRLSQEFITPYTPEQNGMIERFFRSLKEECVWQHNFAGFIEARAAVAG